MTTTSTEVPKGFVEVEGKKCMVCGNNHTVVVKEKDLKKFEKGEALVQHCFPYLSKEGREILISGISGECWTKAFGDDEDEE